MNRRLDRVLTYGFVVFMVLLIAGGAIYLSIWTIQYDNNRRAICEEQGNIYAGEGRGMNTCWTPDGRRVFFKQGEGRPAWW